MSRKINTKEAKGGGTTPAIAIFAFGNKAYGYFAQHLALSLRVNSPSVRVHLWAADGMNIDHSLFTAVHRLDPKWYADGPGRLKLNIHDILPKGDWLYLDADTINVSDIAPHIELLKAHDFAIEVKGKGGEADDIPYTPWATQATIKRVNDLPDNATYFGVQSSWMWIRKGSKLCTSIFGMAKGCTYQFTDLKEKWGKSIPDELCIATALTALDITPHSAELSFYGNGREFKGLRDMAQKHPLVCLYGDNRQHRLVRSTWMGMYDRYVRNLYQKESRSMGMDIYRAMQYKYVNT